MAKRLRGVWYQDYRQALAGQDLPAAADVLERHITGPDFSAALGTQHPQKIARLIAGLTDQMITDGKTFVRNQGSLDRAENRAVQNLKSTSRLVNQFYGAVPAYFVEDSKPITEKIVLAESRIKSLGSVRQSSISEYDANIYWGGVPA